MTSSLDIVHLGDGITVDAARYGSVVADGETLEDAAAAYEAKRERVTS